MVRTQNVWSFTIVHCNGGGVRIVAEPNYAAAIERVPFEFPPQSIRRADHDARAAAQAIALEAQDGATPPTTAARLLELRDRMLLSFM